MSTQRQLILAKIESILTNGYAGLRGVQLNRSTPVERDTLPLPYAFVYSDVFSRVEGAAIGQDEWTWKIYVELYWDGVEDVEEIYKKLYIALADNTLSTVCDWFILTNGQEFVIEEGKVLQFGFECRYHNTFGTP